jgi:hypothetical protein
LLFSRTTALQLSIPVDVCEERGLRTAVDVDAVLEAVDGGDLALTALVGTADNGDLVLEKVSIRQRWGKISKYLHPCGWECCALRASRGAPYSKAPEGC